MAQAVPQARIASVIKNEQRVALKGTTSPLLAQSVDTGRMPGGQNLGRMILQLSPSEEQEQAAEKLVGDLHDPSSPQFHKWLTPADYGRQFGVANEDTTKVEQWLQSQGLTVHEISQSRRFIVFSGTVSQVEDAFATQMHSYEHKAKPFISNATDIQIPAALVPVVKGVVRLHSDPRAPLAYQGTKVHFKKNGSHFTFDDGAHYMSPADFAKIYNVQPLYDAGFDGTGQTIAIVGRSNIDVENIRDFRSLLGLPENMPEVIVNGDDPGAGLNGDMLEAMLDVTWAGAVAPMVKIKFVVSQSNFSDGVDVSAAYIVDHNVAPVMSTSFGACEDSLGTVANDFYNALWKQAAAQGITSFVSSGDNGGAGCDSPGSGYYASGGLAVNGISATPYNVSVGGTQFDDTDNPDAYWSSVAEMNTTTGLSAKGYIPEKVWNESSSDPNFVGLWAGSGGVSTLYAKPNWQAAPGVPNDGKRDLPDISLTAASHDGYLVCLFRYCSYGDYFYGFGGTSASSPAAAGIMALVNQKLGGQPQGNANYVLYKLASIPGVYHDTTKGDNKVPDGFGQYTVGYAAGTGYDLATGLGSFDATALANNWQAAATAVGSITTLALGSGQRTTVVHGAPINVRATVRCSAGGSCAAPIGSVSLLATSASGEAIASGLGQLTAGASTSTSNIQTNIVPGGAMTITARYGGDGKYFASTSGPVAVTVTPEPSQTYLGMIAGGYITDAPISVGYGEPFQIGIAVAGNSGYGYPTGQLTLQDNGQPIQTVSWDPGAGKLTPSTLTLNYGEKSTLLVSGNLPASQSSTISYIDAGLPVGSHQLQASYPGDASFGSSQSNNYSFTVAKADSLFQDIFPVGTAVANATLYLGGQVGLASDYFAPYGGTVTITDVTGATPVTLGVGNVDSAVYGSFFVSVVLTNPPGNICDPTAPVCRHYLKYDYSGDKNLNPVSMPHAYLDVYAKASPYVSLSADVSPAMASSAVTLTATVDNDVRFQPATGTVTFLDGTTTLGTVPLVTTGTPGILDGGRAYGVATLVTTTLAGGTHNITAHYAGDAITYATDSAPVTETITDYAVQVFPGNVVIHDGTTGTASFNIVPLGGFAQAVQFSCGTLPANVSCSFSKSSVTLDGVNPTVVTLTIGTRRMMASAKETRQWGGALATFAVVGLLLPFGMRRRLKGAFAVLCLMGVALLGVGCSSGTNPSNAKAGTYTIAVTVTTGTGAGAMTKSAPVTVTIVN